MATWNRGVRTDKNLIQRRARTRRDRAWGNWDWSSAPRGIRRGPHYGKAKRIAHEREAVRLLEGLGFSDIDYRSQNNSQFFVDAIATFAGQRVLVEISSRSEKDCEHKKGLADSLRMPLYVFFLSPDGRHQFLLGPLTKRVARVPFEFFGKPLRRVRADSVKGHLQTPAAK